MIHALLVLMSNSYQCSDFSQVEAMARMLQSIVPDDIVSMQFLGLVHYRSGNIKSARRYFVRAWEKKLQRRIEQEAKEHQFDGEMSAAAACYREATVANPNLAGGWYDLGITLGACSYLEQAESAFQAALSAKPGFPEAEKALHSVNEKLGQRP